MMPTRSRSIFGLSLGRISLILRVLLSAETSSGPRPNPSRFPPLTVILLTLVVPVALLAPLLPPALTATPAPPLPLVVPTARQAVPIPAPVPTVLAASTLSFVFGGLWRFDVRSPFGSSFGEAEALVSATAASPASLLPSSVWWAVTRTVQIPPCSRCTATCRPSVKAKEMTLRMILMT